MRVRVREEGRDFEVRPGQSVLEALNEGGFGLAAYCGGRGICGKCAVRLLSGDAEPPSQEELDFLSRFGLPDGIRLACRLIPSSPIEISIPDEVRLKQELDYDRADTAVALPMPDPFPSRGTSSNKEYGAAVDIGTTTLSARLINLSTGTISGTLTRFNPQIRFGADVVSRLATAYKNPEKLGNLRTILVTELDRMIADLAKSSGITTGSIRIISAAGNTAMSHLLLGLDIDTLAVYPFETPHLLFPPVKAESAGFRSQPDAELFLAPGIRSFVGGDISAGIHALGLLRTREKILFLDLGTNGELVLVHPGGVLTASTAAGPAFEAANISRGLPAVPGAICRASWNGTSFDTETIASVQPAIGICGTGLFDVLSGGLRAGLITPDGQLTADNLPVTATVTLSPLDIRQFQLALAAVKAGVKILLDRAGLGFSDLDRIIIAGSFGSRLSPESIPGTGLIPVAEMNKLEFPGNTSLQGAGLLLGSRSARSDLEKEIGKVEHVGLASDARFQDFYIDALEFRPLV